MNTFFCCLMAFLLVATPAARGQVEAIDLNAPSGGLPVRGLVVFKDGHVLVQHRGRTALGEGATARFRNLPDPMLGTFWPWCAQPGLEVHQASVGWRKVNTSRSAEGWADLIKANPGARIVVAETDGAPYEAAIHKESPLLNETTALFEVPGGVKLLPLSRLRHLTFRGATPVMTVTKEAREKVLEMHVGSSGEKGGATPGGEIELGITYVSSGFRWIPSYRIELDGEGEAKVTLSATLINDLRDITDCHVKLVVGVPHFSFKDQLDPMALTAAVQSVVNATPMRGAAGRIMTQSFSNAIWSPDMGGQGSAAPASSTDDMKAMNQVEDLYVFDAGRLNLKKGDRMTCRLGSFTVPCADRYTLDIPVEAPGEISGVSGRTRPSGAAAGEPRVMHQIRLTNSSNVPFTTAPALIFSRGSLVAQSMMRFTSKGGRCDIPLTKALEVKVNIRNEEISRRSDDMTLGDTYYHRVNYSGTITLASASQREVTVEVRRYLVGHMDKAPQGGTKRAPGPFDYRGDALVFAHLSTTRWRTWWNRVNSVVEAKWTVKLAPGATKELPHSWYYYWR